MMPRQIWHFPHCNLYVMTRWLDSERKWRCFGVHRFNNSWVQSVAHYQSIGEQFFSDRGTFVEQL